MKNTGWKCIPTDLRSSANPKQVDTLIYIKVNHNQITEKVIKETTLKRTYYKKGTMIKIKEDFFFGWLFIRNCMRQDKIL